ncbi:MAG: hypothetical protein OJF60_002194 [Burkholderiaceae bacterium]|jgi:hypothetical protein|nr:MAG: hypothetical protein OJF60_002194 [Burkholderiaceae bacterium]
MKKQGQPIGDQVASLRQQIAGLQTARRAVLDQKRSREQVTALFDQLIDARHAEAIAAATRELLKAAAGQPVVLDPILAIAQGSDAAKAAMRAHLDAVVPEGMTPAARAARIVEIDAALNDLETKEEALICESELTASPIMRRSDARPEIILAEQ